MAKRVKYPFGKADSLSADYAATIEVAVENQESVLTIGQLTGAATLNLDVDAEMAPGANLLIKTSVDGTNRVLTHGTGLTGAATTLTANKTYALSYKFDGSTFVHTGTQLLN